MIKGKYVATVVIDFNIREDDMTLKPFDEIRDAARNDLTPNIQELLQGAFRRDGKVTVSQQYADVYQVKEDECGENSGKPTTESEVIDR